jgi:hypothetical protein
MEIPPSQYAQRSPLNFLLMLFSKGYAKAKPFIKMFGNGILSEFQETALATSSASLAATFAIGFSAVSRPVREASMGLTSRRAS